MGIGSTHRQMNACQHEKQAHHLVVLEAGDNNSMNLSETDQLLLLKIVVSDKSCPNSIGMQTKPVSRMLNIGRYLPNRSDVLLPHGFGDPKVRRRVEVVYHPR